MHAASSPYLTSQFLQGRRRNNERDERKTLETQTLNASLLNFSCGDNEFSMCGKSFRNEPTWVREIPKRRRSSSFELPASCRRPASGQRETDLLEEKESWQLKMWASTCAAFSSSSFSSTKLCTIPNSDELLGIKKAPPPPTSICTGNRHGELLLYCDFNKKIYSLSEGIGSLRRVGKKKKKIGRLLQSPFFTDFVVSNLLEIRFSICGQY